MSNPTAVPVVRDAVVVGAGRGVVARVRPVEVDEMKAAGFSLTKDRDARAQILGSHIMRLFQVEHLRGHVLVMDEMRHRGIEHRAPFQRVDDGASVVAAIRSCRTKHASVSQCESRCGQCHATMRSRATRRREKNRNRFVA